MEFVKTNLLKLKKACLALAAYYIKCTGAFFLIAVFFFGVLLPTFQAILITMNRQPSFTSDAAYNQIFLKAAYITSFAIVVGIKLVCRPIMSFFVKCYFGAEKSKCLLKVWQSWQDTTIGYTVVEIFLATILPRMNLLDLIFPVVRYYMIYSMVAYFVQLWRQDQRSYLATRMKSQWA